MAPHAPRASASSPRRPRARRRARRGARRRAPCSRAGSLSRSTSTWMRDSRAPSRPAGANEASSPSVVAHGLDERMHEEVQRVALAVQLHRHRVDEEGHVVVHDLDHGVRARPAVLLDARVVHAQLRRARGEAAREREVRHGGAVEVLGRAGAEVLGVDLVVVEREELAGLLRGRARPGAGRPGEGRDRGWLAWSPAAEGIGTSLLSWLARHRGQLLVGTGRRPAGKRHFRPRRAALFTMAQ